MIKRVIISAKSVNLSFKYFYLTLQKITAVFYSKEDIVNQLITATAQLTLLKNGIIHYSYTSKTEITIENHWENHYALLNIATHKKHPLLIDTLHFFNISNEVKILVRTLEPKIPIIGRAFVTDSLAEKLLVKFFQRRQKTMYPLKIFSDYKPALEWLLALK